MGRGKIEMKAIENQCNRQVTFNKRRKCLFKKANELFVLCDAQVAVIVFSNTGKLFENASSSMKRILERYSTVSGLQLCQNEYEHMLCEFATHRTENEKLHDKLRHMQGEDLDSLPPSELDHLQQTLELAARKVRDRRVVGLERKWAFLNQGVYENQNGYGQASCEAAVVSPVGNALPLPEFRVQPVQPNLHNTEY
uniref:MADS-box protein 29 n=1 Tax=Cunninghamia lanceolata TaxID=28977 RepID=A0A8F2Z0K5_CUNLA|nr:MADS-box protein 29 [Cunninghamia lanceolata]